MADETDWLARLRLQHEIEQFYYREAGLLDDRQFEEWIKLFSTEVSYWAPVRINREGAPDVVGEGEMAFFEDDYGTLEVRAQSYGLKSAWAEIPPSRTRHFVTNVVITEDRGEELSVDSNFLVIRTRLETVHHTFSGKRQDVLERRRDGSWLVRDRKIFFDDAAFMTDNISVLF